MACSEGHRLSGIRTEGYQSLRCPTCGLGIFVLPRSVLPEPVAPSVATQAAVHHSPLAGTTDPEDEGPVALTDPIPVPATEGDTDGEIEWVDEPVVEASHASRSSPEELAQEEIAASARAAGPKVRARPKQVARAPVVEPEPVAPRVPLAEVFRRNRNLFLIVGVVLIVVGTVAIRTWRTRQQELPRIAELGRVEGLPALDEGKFVRAYQLLSEAKRAVIELGDAYQGAEAIKQGADEAEIISQRLSDTLETLLDEASRSDPMEWEKKFNTLYKGRSIIVDGSVVAIPDSQGEGTYELDYQILPPGGDGGPPRSVGKIETKGFRLLELIKPRKNDRITFGAKLASFRFDREHEIWQVGLEPGSGVIMTHNKALEALGWPTAVDLSVEDQP